MSLFGVHRALRNDIAVSTLSRFASQTLAIFLNFVLARALGVTGFGEYAFISALILIGNAVSTFGTDMVLIRKISAEKDYSDIPASLALQLGISFVFIVCVYIFSPLESLRVYAFSLIPLSFFTVATIALRGSQQIRLFSFLHFTFSFLQCASACLIYLFDKNINQLALFLTLSHTFSAVIGLAVCFYKIPGFIMFSKPSFGNIIRLAQTSFSLALIGSLRLLYERLPVTIFPFFANLFLTGLFSASARVLDAIKLGYVSALTPIYPEMARDKTFLSRQTGLGLLLVLAICLSSIVFSSAKYLIVFLFGGEFESGARALQIMVWALPFYVLVSYYSLGFLALELEKPVLISLAFSLLGLLSALMLATRLYGLAGGAAATLFAEILQASLLFVQWRRYALSQLPK